MGDRPVKTAIERFKDAYANAHERICLLDTEYEKAMLRNAELEAEVAALKARLRKRKRKPAVIRG